jgi:hypothetical protein
MLQKEIRFEHLAQEAHSPAHQVLQNVFLANPINIQDLKDQIVVLIVETTHCLILVLPTILMILLLLIVLLYQVVISIIVDLYTMKLLLLTFPLFKPIKQ